MATFEEIRRRLTAGEDDSFLLENGVHQQSNGELINLYLNPDYATPSDVWSQLGNHIIRKGAVVAAGASQPYDFKGDAITDEYYVSPIMYGTFCFLYYNKGGWQLGSRRSSDLIGVEWRGDETFDYAFAKAIEPYYKFSYKALNKAKTYSFVMHSKRIHLFSTEAYSEYGIQYLGCRHNDFGTPLEYDEIGVPLRPVFKQEECNKLFESLDTDKNNLGYVFRSRRENVAYILKSRLHLELDKLIGEERDEVSIALEVRRYDKEHQEKIMSVLPSIADTIAFITSILSNVAIRFSAGRANNMVEEQLLEDMKGKDQESYLDTFLTTKNEWLQDRIDSFIRYVFEDYY